MAEMSDEIIRICSCWHSPLICKSAKQHQKCTEGNMTYLIYGTV